MNAIILITTLFALAGQNVETAAQPSTQLYVKTVPAGAEVKLDGTTLGTSNGLFDVSAGSHKLSLEMEDYVTDQRTIEVRQGEITRVETTLKVKSDGPTVLSHVGGKQESMYSVMGDGFAVAFQRPAGAKSISAVKIYAARYGLPQPPQEDFCVYLLDQDKKVLEKIAFPYGKVERMQRKDELCWYKLDFPAVAVPDKFFVALWFNSEPQKGIFLGWQKAGDQKYSYAGLPDKGYQEVTDGREWMVRAVVSAEAGKKPSRPKVTTYGSEEVGDTEEAAPPPMRTWSDKTGVFTVEAQYLGVEDGKVKLKKANGKTLAVPVEQLSQTDRDFLDAQTALKRPAKSGPRETRELSHDNGAMASSSSIGGGAHGVRFKVDGDSWYVTSVSLHGGRYGYPRPPKENFKVWLCDDKFKPIASFEFPYGAFAYGNPGWKSFRVRPTHVPENFIVCFGFNPQQTKGVRVSFDAQKSETSLVGIPDQGDPQPFKEGNWLIRCKVEQRAK
jgi:hypothetical protein